MNRRYTKALASVLYLICATALLGMLAYSLDIISFAHKVKIFLGIIVVISGYCAGCFRCLSVKSRERRKKIIRSHIFIIFLFYITMLIDFTLIDDSFGRNIFNVFNWNSDALTNYINNSTNIVPFATIKLFFNGYLNSNVTFSVFVQNIIGNIIVFMPLSFFVSCLFKNFNKWYVVFVAVLLSVLMVEFLQFVFMTGSSDIDDVILNVSGAMIFYGLLKIRVISEILSRFTFGVWEIEK